MRSDDMSFLRTPKASRQRTTVFLGLLVQADLWQGSSPSPSQATMPFQTLKEYRHLDIMYAIVFDPFEKLTKTTILPTYLLQSIHHPDIVLENRSCKELALRRGPIATNPRLHDHGNNLLK
jgi:hypothetical protein